LPKCGCPKGGSMQRKVAYVFLYKNGIRERSVGIVRRYGTAEQPEVALELFGKELQQKRWKIYYFTKSGALAEATYLWGSTGARGTNEVRTVQCRLCAEAGAGEGIVLLPMEVGRAEQTFSGEPQAGGELERTTDGREFREYLCARYDGEEISAEELRKAVRRKPLRGAEENPCVESAKRLMEEIARAAGGELSAEGDTAEERKEAGTVEKKQTIPMSKKPKSPLVKNLEKLMRMNPAYTPCHGSSVDYSVRILPEDLQCLPKESREYTENSYLLHGYYRYRHVLLGRRIRKEKEEYVLMVPGVYSRREVSVAKLFGFPEFLPVKKTKPETGSVASGGDLFGYFCGKI